MSSLSACCPSGSHRRKSSHFFERIVKKSDRRSKREKKEKPNLNVCMCVAKQCVCGLMKKPNSMLVVCCVTENYYIIWRRFRHTYAAKTVTVARQTQSYCTSDYIGLYVHVCC